MLLVDFQLAELPFGAGLEITLLRSHVRCVSAQENLDLLKTRSKLGCCQIVGAQVKLCDQILCGRIQTLVQTKKFHYQVHNPGTIARRD